MGGEDRRNHIHGWGGVGLHFPTRLLATGVLSRALLCFLAGLSVCKYIFYLVGTLAAGKKLLSCQVRSAIVSSEQSCWA